MKILFTGGGTGGHFYPIIAVAEAIQDIVKEQKIIEPEYYYMASIPYDPRALFDNNIKFVKVIAGKRRNYFSIMNFFDLFKTAFGMVGAIFKIFNIYPDIVFSKGGFDAFPVVFAANIFKIPVVIHESDTVPGRVNIWASKYAKRIAISWPEASKYFDKEKIALTGNPIRKGIIEPLQAGAYEYLKLDPAIPTILIIGGSQGAKMINDTVLSALPNLIQKYQIIHQTGIKNFEEVKLISETILKDSEFISRYKPFPYLNDLAIRMSAGISAIVVSRAGSAMFEFASWGVPAIIIPIPKEISRDQLTNAFAYNRTGAGIVIEEQNLTPNILYSEIDRLINNKDELINMAKCAKIFAKKDASLKIAKAILDIALVHEK